MKIVIISGTAPPEPVTAGRAHYDLAEHLSTEGNVVWFISPKPTRPLGMVYPETNGNVISTIKDNFFHVRLNSYAYPSYDLLKRARESVDFGYRSAKFINTFIRDYDIIYASPWAFLGQLIIILLRCNKKRPLIMDVQDLYPESYLTKIRSGFLKALWRPLFAIDWYIARKSAHLTVISESLKRVYTDKRKIPVDKVTVIQNWQDPEPFINTKILKEDILNRYNLNRASDRFIYMYLGNIGPVAGVETILDSFALLGDSNTFLIIAGSGSAREKCYTMAQKLNLETVAFIDVPSGLQPVVELQGIADVLLLPIHPEAANSSIPSKLIAYMFSGKPVITSANMLSETASAIKESGCGWIIKSNGSSDWVEAMDSAMKTENSRLNNMGRSGYEYAMEHYSKKSGLIRMTRVLDNFNNSN